MGDLNLSLASWNFVFSANYLHTVNSKNSGTQRNFYLQVVESSLQFCFLTMAHQEGENIFDVVRDQLATVLKCQHAKDVSDTRQKT